MNASPNVLSATMKIQLTENVFNVAMMANVSIILIAITAVQHVKAKDIRIVILALVIESSKMVIRNR